MKIWKNFRSKLLAAMVSIEIFIIGLHSISVDNQEGKYILRNFLFWSWSCNSCVSQTLTGSDMLLEPKIFVRQMVFIIPKCHSYYPENFRSEAYGLNESHFSVKLWLGQTGLWNRKFSSDIWFLSTPGVIVTTLKISDPRLMG